MSRQGIDKWLRELSERKGYAMKWGMEEMEIDGSEEKSKSECKCCGKEGKGRDGTEQNSMGEET